VLPTLTPCHQIGYLIVFNIARGHDVLVEVKFIDVYAVQQSEKKKE